MPVFGVSYMKFRTKLIAGFSCVVFVMSVVLGMVYYQYDSKRLMEIRQQNLSFYAQRMAASIDETVDAMKGISDFILSDQDMLSAIQSFPAHHKSGNVLEQKNQLEILTSGISLYYIARNFYRVIIFNEYGDVATSTNAGALIITKEREISEIPWLEDAKERKGKILLVPPHKDGWGARKNPQVFSVVRKVQGGDFGYIEIQNHVDKLKTIFQPPDPEVLVAAWLPDGELLYQSEGLSHAMLTEGLKQKKEGESFFIEPKEKWVRTAVSDQNGISVAVFQTARGFAGNMTEALLMAGGLALACFGISMMVVIMIANRLSRPIVSLREQMENTGIENLDTKPIISDSGDEVEALGIAYQNLIQRLNEAMVKEQKLSLLQLQTQFDALQAQVNPHFLYNVLNVISNRGVMSGDEEICEICGNLAGMLRYATNNVERYATVEQEIEYLKKYIYLLKSRYEHRLEVEIFCEESIQKEILPKIVLQQLVENSVIHGFVNSASVMKIQVRGWRDAYGWYLKVYDNGQGITEEVLNNLNIKIEKIKKKILTRKSSIEMEIGGMGLANTYARMFLLYAHNTIFQIENLEEGVCITIGVAEEEDKHVSGDVSR